MKLLAFDLETTGIDPQKDQILQIGAVAFDPETGEQAEFETVVNPGRIEGDPYALQMNAWLLKRIANGEGLNTDSAIGALLAFIYKELGPHSKPIPVGFNVRSFDVAFVKAAQRHSKENEVFHHRSVELGTLLMGMCGSFVPVSSNQAVKLLGEERVVHHDALADARDAANLYMLWYNEVFKRQ